MAWGDVSRVARLDAGLRILEPGGVHGADCARLPLGTYDKLLEPAHRDIIIRTFVMAAAVSIACAVLAFPLAYYMARYATSRMKTVLYLVVIMPLWSSYLVRALAWRQILTNEGIWTWGL